jgi:hypothetical protein
LPKEDKHKGQLIRIPPATVEAIRTQKGDGSLSYWATAILNDWLGIPPPLTPEQAKAAAGSIKKPRKVNIKAKKSHKKI